MYIQATKKLLDQLEIKGASPTREEEALFTWHANLITINRRKTVVLVNDASRYCLVLYGMKKKDWESWETLILSAIRKVLLDEGISEEVVERYIEQAGLVDTYKSKNRQTTAWVNKACDYVQLFEYDFDEHASLVQTEMSKKVSRYLVGLGTGTSDYFVPYEQMLKDLEAFAGGPIFKRQAVVVHIRMRLEHFQVWRRLLVPTDISFYSFHEILQIAFGWTNSHLHEFEIVSLKNENKSIALLVHDEEAFEYGYETPMFWDTEVRLTDYLPQFQVVYTYDYGDNWQHEVVVEDVLQDYDKPFAICLDGAGDRPPEDVGGEGGYDEFKKAMTDDSHPEHYSFKEWVSTQWGIEFDLDHVNRRLRYV
ncbi:plasmid pRiA4b ORF-3 family protein [Pullulanibacillus sp. KACC 23026]|uniref:plasmid pRiA4b ORF-3 family protein n=1 Tax=Pullulanibacillus sp. KACC 23026 TaxID=3028315 RepID=UPI0023AEA438|nr:plasmid pRiA4b ORF-3 family protein [Pullulanibacillus sp. KACC 23026]WEG13402.1 plasmid pRiA4b ORF-3 family protein [Pullulanibacillus sp. KACC 23026]